MKAVLMGSGNVARHLAPALQQAGVEWVQVYSRTPQHAQLMAGHLGGIPYTSELEKISGEAQLYWLAVSDEAVAELASRLRLPDKTVVHVSGSVPLQTLRSMSKNHGVFYCFQTFNQNTPCPDLKQTPVCLEASNPETLAVLQSLAAKISDTVCVMDSSARAALHLAGVFACNYTNLMYKAAYDIMQAHGINFKLLLPLIRRTALRQDGTDPLRFQTGPAARGDYDILERHAGILGSDCTTQNYIEIYNLLADTVIDKTRKNG